jgi:hypothetical protein
MPHFDTGRIDPARNKVLDRVLDAQTATNWKTMSENHLSLLLLFCHSPSRTQCLYPFNKSCHLILRHSAYLHANL